MPGTSTTIQAQRKSPPGLFVSIANSLLDLLYPPRCAHCGRVDYHWCDLCDEDLTALPLDLTKQLVSAQLIAASTGEHDLLLQHAVHALKYGGVKDISITLGERLNKALTVLDWQFDCTVPVPMHPTRLIQRGYNQAALLAAQFDQPMIDGLIRVRETRSQVGLNRIERLENVQDAFSVTNKEDFSGKAILLIDDVLTTGATLVGCAYALYEAGASTVYALTVTTARQ